MKLGFIFDVSDLPPPAGELIIVHANTSTARTDYRLWARSLTRPLAPHDNDYEEGWDITVTIPMVRRHMLQGSDQRDDV
jgi:hypothetical protein